MSYLIHLSITCLLFGTLAMSLSMIVNWCGIFAVMQGALFGAGAYTAAIASDSFGLSPAVTLIVAIGAGAMLGGLVSRFFWNVVDDEFILVVLASQLIFSDALKIAPTVTGGNNGLRIVHSWFASSSEALFFVFLCTAFSLLLLARLRRSAFGRALHVMREDAVLCSAFGYDTGALRTMGFAISGGLAAMMGALYAHYIGFIDPTSFGLNQSISILTFVMAAGTKLLFAPFLCAVALVLLPESLRFVEISGGNVGYIRQIMYGLVLLFVVWRTYPTVATRPSSAG